MEVGFLHALLYDAGFLKRLIIPFTFLMVLPDQILLDYLQCHPNEVQA